MGDLPTLGAPARAVAIVNPVTRRDAARIVDLLKMLAPPATELEVRLTERAGHARELARERADGADMLIAVGGDGTVGELAAVAHERGLDLGIVPAGSTNIIARELGIPANPHMAVRLLFEPHSRVRIDAGVCGDRVFLHMAGAGLDSLMFDLTDPRLKRRVGWMAYVPATARALRQPLARYDVRSTEMTLAGVASPLVLVANGGSIIAPSIVLDREIRYDDGRLDVLVVTATRPHELARVMARMATRRMGASPFVTHFTTTAVEIVADPPIAFQVDGDITGITPVSIGLRPAAVKVVTPLHA